MKIQDGRLSSKLHCKLDGYYSLIGCDPLLFYLRAHVAILKEHIVCWLALLVVVHSLHNAPKFLVREAITHVKGYVDNLVPLEFRHQRKCVLGLITFIPGSYH